MLVDEIREAANEIRFLLDPQSARAVAQWACLHVGPDPHATEAGSCYRTRSLYFDTDDFAVLHQRGSYARSKYRVRQYGPGETAFLERKLKKNGAVSKRRSIVRMEDLSHLESPAPERGWGGYWFHRRILARQLRPVCQISYLRMARVTQTSCGPLRLTLDRELRAHRTDSLRFAFDRNEKTFALSERQPILELKYRQEMPPLFAGLIAEFGLTTKTVSKYRLAAAALDFPSAMAAQVA